MQGNDQQQPMDPYGSSPYQTQYTVRQQDEPSALQRVSDYITTMLLSLVYLTMAAILMVFVYSGFIYGCKLRRHSYRHLEYRGVLAKMDLLEKSVRNECRLASMSLRSDLNELTRHVDLSGLPLLDFKHHVMKVFFPGINNHPLLVKSLSSSHAAQPATTLTMGLGPQSLTFSSSVVNIQQQQQPANNLMLQQQQTIQRPIKQNTSELPMDHFERLILNKPFLLAFINTLERQPTFSIRDRVNVGSLIMIVLMGKLDYATDILRTLLLQLVERSLMLDQGDEEYELQIGGNCDSKSRLSQRAFNLLGGLPISKRAPRAAKIGKVVGGSASSLMASTTVAAQMFISRVGNKTSPLDPNPSEFLTQQNSFNSMTSTLNHTMSTTTFNHHHQQQRQHGQQMAHTISGRSAHGRNRAGRAKGARGKQIGAGHKQSAAHLMLRRTDSIVEKMLTDWLALNMYEHFHGDIGRSLYMMFEALRCQLERGPVDAIAGDAYYSLNEHKLLKEPFIQFDIINLYVIVDTEILQPNNSNTTASLIDSSMLTYGQQPIYGESGDCLPSFKGSHCNYSGSATNTITLAVRVLDCDTISQVKAKILSALYRNSPSSGRVGVDGVELILRQYHQSMHGQSTLMSAAQYSTLRLQDEDYTSLAGTNGMRRVNTLKHYGVNDQAIVALNRCRSVRDSTTSGNNNSNNRTALTDILDEHYNNPYSEIQYGPLNDGNQQQAAIMDSRLAKSWHLVRSSDPTSNNRNLYPLSSDSSSSSHSPSMMLLGNESLVMPSSAHSRVQTLQNNNFGHQHHQQQQSYYHPSSSSTSSASGNVPDTNSTSANSLSANVTNLLARSHGTEQQPIYCQIGSQTGANSSSYYCQVGGAALRHHAGATEVARANDGITRQVKSNGLSQEQEKKIYLTRMLTSKGTVQYHIDDFFKTILSARPPPASSQLHEQANDENIIGGGAVLCSSSISDFARSQRNLSAAQSGACPPAVKWLFDLLDEAALRAGIADQSIVHAWKSNAFLLRFWVNFIKNPDYIMDVEKSGTLDATLSVVAQTLMDSCATGEPKLTRDSTCNKLIFAKNLPKYQNQVKQFYQDVASIRPVSDQDIVKHMSSLSVTSAGRFDTHLALKELFVYANNYGVEIMGALSEDHTCQQLGLSQKLEQCFRSFTLFDPYR